ncbi:MAG: hypothetical protein JWO02_3306 [Solirubrobacterales bacterium]|nr:hypothetical protein [Solirubrobacterales bacterium]
MVLLAKVLVSGALLVGLVACGASSGSKSSAAYTAPAQASSSQAPATPTPAVGGSCRQVATNELADVARRVYAQAVQGGGVVTAVKRLQRSSALATAVSGGRRTAVEAAFLPIRHQIVRIELFDLTHRVYSFGTKPTFAPIRGDLHDAGGRVVGHFILAVSDQRAYSALVQRLARAATVFRTGPHAASRKGFQTIALATHAYPSGPLHIDVQIPTPPSALCGADNADTRLRTIGYVGRRLLAAERNSRAVEQTLRFAAHDPAFRAATAANDPAAIRAVIIRDFFGNHSHHIVRVRVTRGSQLIYDLGGPYVLQPATGTVRSPDGKTSATFTLAVQDDTGYIKLMHRFTGADVQLTSPLGKVPGSTLAPGPDQIPDHGPVTYQGRRYLADSYTGTAFPSGTLRISLLVRG